MARSQNHPKNGLFTCLAGKTRSLWAWILKHSLSTGCGSQRLQLSWIWTPYRAVQESKPEHSQKQGWGHLVLEVTQWGNIDHWSGWEKLHSYFRRTCGMGDNLRKIHSGILRLLNPLGNLELIFWVLLTSVPLAAHVAVALYQKLRFKDNQDTSSFLLMSQ